MYAGSPLSQGMQVSALVRVHDVLLLFGCGTVAALWVWMLWFSLDVHLLFLFGCGCVAVSLKEDALLLLRCGCMMYFVPTAASMVCTCRCVLVCALDRAVWLCIMCGGEEAGHREYIVRNRKA